MERLEKEGLESLSEELKIRDPLSYESIDIANKQRVVRALEVTITTGRTFSSFKSNTVKERPFSIKKICLVRDREILYDRINRRVDKMIQDGLVEEVAGLRKYRNMPSLNTVGYREIFEYLDGEISLERAVELIKRNTRHFAKRQMTWWRDEEKLQIS